MGLSTSELKFKSMLVEVFRVALFIVDAPVPALLLLSTGLGYGRRQTVGCAGILYAADSPAGLGGVALRGVTHA